MSTQRYQHLRQRVRAKDAPFHASIASASKEKKENAIMKKLEEWKLLSTNNEKTEEKGDGQQ